MRQGGANSFFRFVLGFTFFIALSFVVTYAVSTYSIAQQKQRQTASAFQVLVGGKAAPEDSWLSWLK